MMPANVKAYSPDTRRFSMGKALEMLGALR
jgi:hypothetical protein